MNLEYLSKIINAETGDMALPLVSLKPLGLSPGAGLALALALKEGRR